MKQHYKLPAGNVQIAFSGGRTSAYMLHEILSANGDLPERVAVTFQNTGREMPQTLDFVNECEQRWGVKVTWLEYRGQKPFFELVGRERASVDGQPFEALVRKKKYLPNQQARFCTVELKVLTAKRYLRSLGWDKWVNCVGLRADEPARIKPENVVQDRWTIWQPLNHAGVSRRDVSAFWEAQDFDLELPNVNGNCWLGNCDGCFLKSEENLAALARDFPKRHRWWEDMEALASDLTSGKSAQFSKRYSRAEMRSQVERQGDALFNLEGALCQASDGECAPI